MISTWHVLILFHIRKDPGLSDGNLPCGGVSDPTKVLLTLSSVSGDDPQLLPSLGNDMSIA